MRDYRSNEVVARRAIEDRGFLVYDANLVFRANCPNIDLVAFARDGARYIQVKSTTKPARPDRMIVDGSPWTHEQMYGGAPLFNKHAHAFQADLVVLVDATVPDDFKFYVAPPRELERLARITGRVLHKKPKRNGDQRSIAFRKELPRAKLQRWLGAWSLLGEPALLP